jgi:hypothetical protein
LPGSLGAQPQPPGRPGLSFTDFLPPGTSRSPRGHRGRSEDRAMADFLVVIAIVAFVVAMLGLIWGLERI